MDPAPTQYVDRDGSALAYQVFGDGPADLVHFFESFQHLDLQLTDPDMNHNYERVAQYVRAAYFQRRGFGLSDQVPYVPTIEQQADDVLAVMDAVGMRRATLVGWFTTCGAVALAAARVPERVHALVLFSPLAQGPESGGEMHGWTDQEARTFAENSRHSAAHWGSGRSLEVLAPTLNSPFNRRLMAMLERSSATPSAMQSHVEWQLQSDFQEVLKAVQVPASVVYTPNYSAPKAAVQYVADLIPGSTFHALPTTPPGTSMGQAALPMTDILEEIVTGTIHSTDSERFLGTVLFTDVASSTELLERVGDATYRQLRADHERSVRHLVETAGGRLMTVTGDGTLSVFDSPTNAVRCGERICREAENAGISVRAGIHTGELERDAMNVTGLTVHIGARVGAAAEPGEVLVSRTVRDLVAGSGLTFVSRGEHPLKGVSGTWELSAVTRAGHQPEILPAEESMQTPMDRMVLQTARRAPGLARAAVRLGNAVERRRAKNLRA
jgi:class 3 adenylate cyclase/pimeloyl-ACP methyl ester carboxylesterase